MTVKATAHAIEGTFLIGAKYVVHLHFPLPAGSGELRVTWQPERDEDLNEAEEADLGAAFCELDAAAGGKAGDQILKKFFAELVEEMKEARKLIGLLDNPENMVTAAFVINQIRTWMREQPEAADSYLTGRAMLVAAARHDPRTWNYDPEDLKFLWDQIWREGHPSSAT